MPAYISQHEREKFTEQAEMIGTQASELRQALLDARAPFVAGMVRAAEETLLLAFTMLKNSDVREL